MRISDGSADVCSSDLSKLLLSKPLKKWFLLVPVQDRKDVNMHCAKKTAELRGMDLALLDPDFEVCVHDQKQFPGKALHDAMSDMASLSLSVDTPSQEELANCEAGSPDLLANATVKLAKREIGRAHV